MALTAGVLAEVVVGVVALVVVQLDLPVVDFYYAGAEHDGDVLVELDNGATSTRVAKRHMPHFWRLPPRDSCSPSRR